MEVAMTLTATAKFTLVCGGHDIVCPFWIVWKYGTYLEDKLVCNVHVTQLCHDHVCMLYMQTWILYFVYTSHCISILWIHVCFVYTSFLFANTEALWSCSIAFLLHGHRLNKIPQSFAFRVPFHTSFPHESEKGSEHGKHRPMQYSSYIFFH